MNAVETHWYIKGKEFIHCNCAYGCPCQFNALPSRGDCQAIGGIHIEEGRHGETDLSGLNIAAVWRWPGAVHEGHGEVVPIVDERASDEQREGLLRIMSGLDTVEGATVFQVFATTYEKVYDPIFATIDIDIDINGRSARLNVPGVIQARGEPIRNAVTGAESRAQIRLPNGFEYDVAELGRGWATTEGPIAIELADSHAHFAKIDMNQSGVAH